MVTALPKTAFILAAGLGTRLRPITDTQPKPLVCIAGKPIIGHVLDRLYEAGISRVIVNTHHHAEKMQDYLSQEKRFDLHILYESAILETGGSLKNGLALIGDQPFFAINGDAFWNDLPNQNILHTMAQHWGCDKMDILLMLYPLGRMITPGTGDYDMKPDGHLLRALDKKGAYMFASIRICHPKILHEAPEGKFSFLTLMDEAQQKNKLFGIIHSGRWYHVSTPDDLNSIERFIADGQG